MLLKWRRDTVLWVERQGGAPPKIVLGNGSVSVDWLTGFLLPGLADAVAMGDRITLVTAVISFRKEPLLALNVTRGELVRPIGWRIWAITIAPVLLLAPFLMQLGAGWAFAGLVAAAALAFALDAAVSKAAAKLEADPERERRNHLRLLGVNVSDTDEVEPDWDQLLLDRWNGDLDGGYRQDLGALDLPDGRVIVGEPGSLAHADAVTVMPGRHDVWLAVARLPNEERVSHAFLAVSRGKAISVNPVLSESGAPMAIGVDGGLAAFASSAAAERLAAVGAKADLLAQAMRKTRKEWIRFPVPESDDVVMAFRSGYGDGIYPVSTLWNDAGDILAVAIDFEV